MLGNLNEQTIQQVLHGEPLKLIRDTIRQGRLHPQYCYNCIQAERYGRSERDWHNTVNADFDVAAANDHDHVPAIVDVRWNTTCNLSCNYCGEKCSSRWASLKNIPVRSGTRAYVTEVCDYLGQHKQNIKEVALVGGEPLLLQENETVCEVVPYDAVITLITNLSVDLAGNRIFQKLSERNRVGWSISFDNVGERFEYVRHGASWQLLCNNLALVRDLMRDRGHWGGIHAVYNIYNATRLVELTQFARQQELSIQWQSLYQPDFLDPTKLGTRTTRKAVHEIEKLLALDICMPNEDAFFRTVLNSIESSDNTQQLAFAQHIHDMETRWHANCRGQFRALWPELAELCD